MNANAREDVAAIAEDEYCEDCGEHRAEVCVGDPDPRGVCFPCALAAAWKVTRSAVERWLIPAQPTERRAAEETKAACDVLAERERQKAVEGWTEAHDDLHVRGQMAQAAACYAWPGQRPVEVKKAFPWPGGWKPSPQDRRRDLVKAGALILAEIERIDRTPAHRAAE